MTDLRHTPRNLAVEKQLRRARYDAQADSDRRERLRPVAPTSGQSCPTLSGEYQMTDTREAIQSRLAHHSGSSTFYGMGPLFPGMAYTEGVKDLAEMCGAHWLYEAIASHITTNEELRRSSTLLFWRLEVNRDPAEGEPMARLYCFPDLDDEGEELPATVSQDIPHTDFPLDEIEIWAGANGQGEGYTIYLPSEH